MMVFNIIAALIIVLIIIATAFLLEYSTYDKYKLVPVVSPGSCLNVRENEDDSDWVKSINSVVIEVVDENNFDKAFIVDANYNVHALTYNDRRLTLEDGILSETPIETESAKYTYCYVVMKNHASTVSIELIYVKSCGEEVQINGMNKDNVIEFDKGHRGDPFYDGERQLARKYMEMCEYYKQYYEI